MNSVLPILTLTIKGNFERSPRIIKYSLCAMAAMSLPIFVGGYIVAYPLTYRSQQSAIFNALCRDGIDFGFGCCSENSSCRSVFTSLHVVLTYSLVAMGKTN